MWIATSTVVKINELFSNVFIYQLNLTLLETKILEGTTNNIHKIYLFIIIYHSKRTAPKNNASNIMYLFIYEMSESNQLIARSILHAAATGFAFPFFQELHRVLPKLALLHKLLLLSQLACLVFDHHIVWCNIRDWLRIHGHILLHGICYSWLGLLL